MTPIDIIDELTQEFGASGLERVEACLQALVGEIDLEVLHDEHEPSRLNFPGLSARPWYERQDLPWVPSMEAAFPAILEEFRQLRSQKVEFYPYEDPYTRELGWKGWNTYSLYRNTQVLHDARQHCPQTLAAWSQTPYGPREAMFTILSPGTHITPHTGGVNLVLTCHLGLEVPASCAISVANETRTWTEGQCLVFDDSFMHEAWNRGEESRAILLWDIWHPDLTEVERKALLRLFPRLQMYLRGE